MQKREERFRWMEMGIVVKIHVPIQGQGSVVIPCSKVLELFARAGWRTEYFLKN